MKLELFPRFIQVSIDKESYYSQKSMRFAEKHFKSVAKYANSIMIFEDPKERYKKNYFLNWAYHLSIFREDENSKKLHREIIDNIHLPIRVKFTDKRAVIEHVKVEMKFLSEDRISLKLNKHNRVAKRYLMASFRENMVGHKELEIFINNRSSSFWEALMTGIRQKTIFNVSMEFLYDKWCVNPANKNIEIKSYMTLEEKRVRRSLALLNCPVDESLENIKTKYLSLAREYHPDNVYGQEKRVVETYTEKFRAIQEAYEVIKSAYSRAA